MDNQIIVEGGVKALPYSKKGVTIRTKGHLNVHYTSVFFFLHYYFESRLSQSIADLRL